MSIYFEWYNNPALTRKGEKQTLHARPILNGKADIEELGELINRRCTVTPPDIAAVLSALSDVMGEALADGKQVHLNGIGYFCPTLTCTEEIVPETKRKSTKVKLKSIAFRADKELYKAMGNVSVMRMSKFAVHSNELSHEEIDKLLEEYFTESRVLTRRTFQSLCGFTSATARRHLKRLCDEGKLRNEGVRNQPMYLPAEAKPEE
jgi:predicted histone-like DNA-binding protein